MMRATDLSNDEWELLKRICASEKHWYSFRVYEFGQAGLSLVTRGLVTIILGKGGCLQSTESGRKLVADNT